MLRLALVLLLSLLFPPAALAEKRVALVIGIDKYDNLGTNAQLQRARSDAAAVARVLKLLGFDVIAKDDLTRSAFNSHWQDFLNKLVPGDTAAFYYAGHGVEFGGRSYLLPRDVPNLKPGRDELLRREALSLQEFLADLREKGTRLNLVILDACRDNPFEQMAGRSVGSRRGLVVSEPPEGTFIMYSAGTGESALDRLNDADRDPNSVYTRNLLPLLKVPGLSLTDVAELVRVAVRQMAATVQHRQTPAYYNQLVGRMCIARGECDPRDTLAAIVRQNDAAEAWAVAKETTSTAVLEAFIARYSDTFLAELARARIEELKKQQVAVAPPPKLPSPSPATKSGVVAIQPSARCNDVQVAVGTVGETLCVKAGSGISFRDCWGWNNDDACSPEMVVVPTGSFMMGSPASEEDRGRDEGPQRRVTIAKPFAVGKFEVWFAEWDACVAAGGCNHRPGDEGWGRGKLPVMNVSWNDITREYLPWLSRKTGKTYRLLTEAEWEYAARAGSTTRYHFGNDEKDLCGYGNVADQTAKEPNKFLITTSCRDGYLWNAPVGSFRPNAFGLYDTHGNVWEWVEDCWNSSYSHAPTDGSAWTTGDCSARVFRGGGRSNYAGSLRSGARNKSTTADRGHGLGFRVARTLD